MRIPRRVGNTGADLPSRVDGERDTATGVASGVVLGLCRAAGKRLNGDTRLLVERVEAELAEPQLRVAIVGRVSSGKSTLVNSILGRRIAPTEAGECTRMVTCFRHGMRPQGTAHLRDGREVPLPYPDEVDVLADLPVSAEHVAYLEVCLPARPLSSLTVIDSPGISSGGSDVSRQTHELVSARMTRVPTPDAVAFVLTQGLREDELQLLREVDTSNSLMPASTRTVGVLTKADLVGGGGPGAWDAAGELAQSIAQDNPELFVTVVPVIGLLAEVGNCSRLTEDDAWLLRMLAREWGPRDRDLALLARETFLSQHSSLGGQDRDHLLHVLGLAGIRELLECVDRGEVGAEALNAACRRLSGYDRLHDTLTSSIRERADVLKACRALDSLLRVAHGRPARQLSAMDRKWFQDRIEQVRYDPRTHRILELEALHRVLSGKVALPAELERDLIGLAKGGVRGTTALGLAEWQKFEAYAVTVAQRSVARVAIRSYVIEIESQSLDE